MFMNYEIGFRSEAPKFKIHNLQFNFDFYRRFVFQTHNSAG